MIWLSWALTMYQLASQCRFTALTRADYMTAEVSFRTSGTGKSTAIRELIAGALQRGDRAIFADPDGGYRMMGVRSAMAAAHPQ